MYLNILSHVNTKRCAIVRFITANCQDVYQYDLNSSVACSKARFGFWRNPFSLMLDIFGVFVGWVSALVF